MPLRKRTYVLPPEVIADFEDAVSAGKRSAVVADIIRDWLDRRKRQELRRETIEGCREMADVYREIEEEYHPLEEEIHRGLDDQPQAR